MICDTKSGKFFIYVLVDSRNGEEFYVGCTRDPKTRLRSHRYKVGNKSINKKSKRVEEIFSDGGKISLVILNEESDRAIALKLEAEEIKKRRPFVTNGEWDSVRSKLPKRLKNPRKPFRRPISFDDLNVINYFQEMNYLRISKA